MKTVKKIVCVLLIVLSLAGCSNIQNETTTENTTDSPVSEISTPESILNETVSLTAEQTTVTETVTTTANSNETTVITTTAPITTEQTTTVTTTESTTEKVNVCTVTIVCGTINDNIDKLKNSKENFVPSDGIILKDVSVEVNDGETVFDVIKRACNENVCKNNCKYCQKSGIQIEYTYTPAFDNYYIEGIHQIYEKDCGTQSGWMYSVNGVFPNVGTSTYNIKAGDKIVFAYTCNMGEDIGNLY